MNFRFAIALLLRRQGVGSLEGVHVPLPKSSLAEIVDQVRKLSLGTNFLKVLSTHHHILQSIHNIDELMD